MYNMDNITITCKSDPVDIPDMTEKIQMILRQTDYDETIAKEKLIEYNGNEIKVIRAYMGIPDKKPLPKKSLNQEIYRQLRSRLDDSMKAYNIKQEEKLKNEIATNNNKN
jgi:hypothetical protein